MCFRSSCWCLFKWPKVTNGDSQGSYKKKEVFLSFLVLSFLERKGTLRTVELISQFLGLHAIRYKTALKTRCRNTYGDSGLIHPIYFFQHDVSELQKKLESHSINSAVETSGYLVLDTPALCRHLSLLRSLVKSAQFVVVVPLQGKFLVFKVYH